MSAVSEVKKVVVVYRKYQEDITATEGGGTICRHSRRRCLLTVISISQAVKFYQAPRKMCSSRQFALIYVVLSVLLASCMALTTNQTTNVVNKTSTMMVAQVVLKVKPLNASTTTTTTTLRPKLFTLASNGTQKVNLGAKVNYKSSAKAQIEEKPVEVKKKKLTKSNKPFNKDKKNNGTRTKDYGEQQEASLLRPLILRSLGLRGFTGGPNGMMAAQAQAAESQEAQQQEPQQEEEEEEVTQTIYQPIKDSSEVTESESGETETSSEPSVAQQVSSTREPSGKNPRAMLDARASPKEVGHLKPEASLQLTSTEMSSLLNDRDAPEFYRERELQGDGVLVGEERPPLVGTEPTSSTANTAASNLGIHHMGYSNGLAHQGSYESDAFIANHRLAQAASGGGYPGADYSGFSQRFGSFGSDAGDYSGRLMQSPNEYSEYHHGRFNSYPPSDYSAHSGLLRAGSGDYGGLPDSYGHSAAEGFGHSAGAYLNSGHRLEQHSSELYGGPGASYGGGPHSDLGGYYGANQRLLSAAAAHLPGYGGGSHLDDYTSRYGSSLGGFDQRGYAASQHNSVNAVMGAGSSSSRESKLMPLSPIVPVADDIGGSASSAQQFKATSSGLDQHQKVEVNEPLDEQDLQASLAGNDEAATSPSSSSSFSSNNNDVTNENSGDNGLVLNYPPPGSSESSINKPSIEFSRFGSAGYLPPTLSPQLDNDRLLRNNKKILKKMSALMAPASHQLLQSGGSSKSDYDPAENPAHAGKYIID